MFFLEVQGSGRLVFPDDERVWIGYATKNGHPYRSIGRLLVEEGKIPQEQLSMQTIRAYLREHPEEVARVLNANPSKVFFQLRDEPTVGSLNVPITDGRTIATDHRLFPEGALGFLMTDIPTQSTDGTVTSQGSLRRFVLNQDSGGANQRTTPRRLFLGSR